MLWLNAGLAFAVTMLILSMVTSTFVETIHRLLAMRVKGLRLMLGHFFDRVIALHYPDADASQLEKMKSEFIDLMSVNRSPPGTAFKGAIIRTENDQSKDEGLWNWLWRGRRLDHLDVNSFMSRLGASSHGDTVRANGAGASEDVLRDIAQNFESFGDEASEFFQRRARLLSVIVAVFVAWGMFVHPYNLFATYIQRPEITQKVLEMKAGVTAEYVALKKTADEKKDALEAQDAGNPAALDEASKAYREAVSKAEDKMASLQEVGVPIGWNEDRLASAGFQTGSVLGLLPIPMPAEWSKKSLATILWLILGGLLIGLGGPFWYDILNSLTNIKTLVGGQSAQPATAVGNAAQDATSQPKTPVEHFMTAAAGRDATTGGGVVDLDDEAVG